MSTVAERPSYWQGHTHKNKDTPDISPHSDLLHRWRYITGALGNGHMIGHLKRILSRLLYEYFGRRYPQAEWTTTNYSYAAIDPPFPSFADDSPEQFASQLYWYVARPGPLPETFSYREVL